LSEIKPATVYQVAGSPDWKVMAKDSVWVTSARANHVVQLLPTDAPEGKTGIVVDVPKPCSSLAYGWNSIWIPSCGAKKLLRVDETTGKTIAEIPADPANSEGGITIGDGSVFLVVKPSTLLKIDPATNTVVAKLDLPSESENPFFGDGFVWVASFGHNALLKVDPKSMKLVETIPIGPKPRFITIGAGSVWTVNQGDGTVSRVDMRSGRLVATIECGLSGPGGEITFGAGSAWATLFNIPLTQIDPNTNKAVKQWAGKGGDGLQFGFGSLWLSNLAQQTVWRISPDQK
jgi:DNA-binding beta-propeller fold protein YncE